MLEVIYFGATNNESLTLDWCLSSEDNELVNEVLEDISRHEEDYLDLTLEEESQLIAAMKTYLNREPTHTVWHTHTHTHFNPFKTAITLILCYFKDCNSEVPKLRRHMQTWRLVLVTRSPCRPSYKSVSEFCCQDKCSVDIWNWSRRRSGCLLLFLVSSMKSWVQRWKHRKCRCWRAAALFVFADCGHFNLMSCWCWVNKETEGLFDFICLLKHHWQSVLHSNYCTV